MTEPVIVPGSPEHDAAMIAKAEKSGVRIRSGSALSGEFVDITPGATPPADDTGSTPQPSTQPDPNAAAKPAVALPGVKPPAAAPAAVTPPAAKPYEAPKALADIRAAKAELAAAATDEAKTAAQTKLATAQSALADEIAAADEAAAAAAAEAAKKPETPPAADALAQATEEFARDQKLTDGTYEALKKIGLDKPIVDSYIAGLKAQAEELSRTVFEAAGGKDAYAVAGAWATANWTAEQLTEFNAAVSNGDAAAAVGAVKGLKEAYEAATGKPAAVRIENVGGSGAVAPGERYNSKAEYQKDYKDPRYAAGDKAFHATVDRKLAASIAAGIDLGF